MCCTMYDVGCLVFKEGKFLLGKRISESHGGGEFDSYDWFSLDDLPAPLFGAVGNYVDAVNTNQKYFDWKV